MHSFVLKEKRQLNDFTLRKGGMLLWRFTLKKSILWYIFAVVNVLTILGRK